MNPLEIFSINRIIPFLVCFNLIFCAPGGSGCDYQKGDGILIHPALTGEHIRPEKDVAILKTYGELPGKIHIKVQLCWLRKFPPKKWIDVLLLSGNWQKKPTILGESIYAAKINTDQKIITGWFIYHKKFAVQVHCDGPESSMDEITRVWKDIEQRVRKYIDIRCGEEEFHPRISVDRTEGAPGSPLLLLEASHFKKDVNAEITWDGLIIEDNVRIDDDNLRIQTIPGREEVEIRKYPWLWVFIPRDATPGTHVLRAEQRTADIKSNTIEITVKSLTNYQLAQDFDEILGLYGEEVPYNPRSRHGPEWNIFNMFSGPDFKCGDYQAKVIRFCAKLFFSGNINRRKLMDGFDFGPLMSGADVIRFTHHFGVIWPRGRSWPESGVILDPWISQRPRAFVVNPNSSDPWWLNCDWYKPDEPNGFFVDRPAYKDYMSTPRADKLVYGGKEGLGFPTHTFGKFHYEDIINTGKVPPKNLFDGPEIPASRVIVRCPVNVLVTRSTDGKRLGSLSDETPFTEMDDGFCETDQDSDGKFWRFGLPDGKYDIIISAYADGKVKTYILNAKMNEQYNFPEIPVQEGISGEFHLTSGQAPGTYTTSTGQQYQAIIVAATPEKPPSPDPNPTPQNQPVKTPAGPSHFIHISMNGHSPGLLAQDAFLSDGIRISKGAAGIFEVNQGLTVPKSAKAVLLLKGLETKTELVLDFTKELQIFQITRTGVKLGASLPKWRMSAYDIEGNLVDSIAEWEFGLPEEPKRFAVSGQNIVRVVIVTDNDWNGGTYSTYSSLPILSFGLAY